MPVAGAPANGDDGTTASGNDVVSWQKIISIVKPMPNFVNNIAAAGDSVPAESHDDASTPNGVVVAALKSVTSPSDSSSAATTESAHACSVDTASIKDNMHACTPSNENECVSSPVTVPKDNAHSLSAVTASNDNADAPDSNAQAPSASAPDNAPESSDKSTARPGDNSAGTSDFTVLQSRLVVERYVSVK